MGEFAISLAASQLLLPALRPGCPFTMPECGAPNLERDLDALKDNAEANATARRSKAARDAAEQA